MTTETFFPGAYPKIKPDIAVKQIALNLDTGECVTDFLMSHLKSDTQLKNVIVHIKSGQIKLAHNNWPLPKKTKLDKELCQKVQKIATKWALKVGLIAEKGNQVQQRAYEKNADLRVAYLFTGPFAKLIEQNKLSFDQAVDRLATTTKWYLWLFIFDDVIDKIIGPIAKLNNMSSNEADFVQLLADVFLHYLKNKSEAVETLASVKEFGNISKIKFPDENGFNAFCDGIKSFAVEISKFEHKHMLQAFIDKAEHYFKSIVAEVKFRDGNGDEITPEQYYQFRIHTGAVITSFYLAALATGINLPEKLFNDENLLEFDALMSKILGVDNDMVSFWKETKEHQHDNIVSIYHRLLVKRFIVENDLADRIEAFAVADPKYDEQGEPLPVVLSSEAMKSFLSSDEKKNEFDNLFSRAIDKVQADQWQFYQQAQKCFAKLKKSYSMEPWFGELEKHVNLLQQFVRDNMDWSVNKNDCGTHRYDQSKFKFVYQEGAKKRLAEVVEEQPPMKKTKSEADGPPQQTFASN